MELLNDLGKTLEGIARQVEKKSGEIWQAGKLNVEILKQEEAIRRLHRKIGELVSADYGKTDHYGERVKRYCAEVQERKRKIEKLISELRDAKEAGKSDGSSSDVKQEHSRADSADTADMKDGAAAEEKVHFSEPEISYYEAMEKMQQLKQSE